ncbi:MAG: tetratricopeptide repeat protein [bacterium]
MNTLKNIIIILAVAIITSITLPPAFAQTEAMWMNSEAVTLFENGRLQEAVEKLKIASSQEPNNPIILSNLGYIYQALGRYNDGKRVLKQAISIDPMNMEAHNVLGICYYYIGEVEKAASEWEWVARVSPENEASRMNLAIARGEAEISEEPLPEKRKFESAPYPKSKSDYAAEELFYEAKKAYQNGDYQRAVNILHDVLEVKPNSMLSRYYLGLAYGYIGDRDAALGNLREYLILESYPPESPDAYKHARSTFDNLYKTGKMPGRGTPSSADAGVFFTKGKNAYKQKDYFRAIHYLKEAVNRKPDSFPSNFYLGLAYRGVGDKERAVFHLSKCLVLMDSSSKDYKTNKANIQQAIEKVIQK